ncbi:MAG: protein kinase [Planctomycetes bacterium]|nr:protein kinase [Planctomycetota bacterium]
MAADSSRSPLDHDQLEDLLAEALAAFDDGGDAALEAFLQARPAVAAALRRGLERCRQMGLLGGAPPRDFPERLGDFQLVRRIGSGGMGVVYEAEQVSLGRRVALKVVRPELLYFEGARERFRREIEAVARLSHPAIVPIVASGEQDGLPFYAMELLRGVTVQQLCQALHGKNPNELGSADVRALLHQDGDTGTGTATDLLAGTWWQIATRLVHGITLGVRHAHLRGIVHRDIKPSNVMLTADGRTVLLDFGVAMLGGSRDFTRTGGTPGSPAFMSPEQLRGDAVDERTDVYSLGATLWQLLALEAPFRGDKDLQRIRDGEVPPLTAHYRELPRELALVVHKAMDRDRDRRYADVEQFALDLVAVLQRRPIRARRTGLPLRTWRWCQRHRVLATAAASLLGIMLLLPLVLAWRERALNRELQAANAAQQVSVRTTLATLQTMLVTVGDERLRHLPGAGPLAQDMLEKAVVLYRDLLRQLPDSQRLVGNAADTMARLGVTRQRNGDRDGARQVLREEVALLGGDQVDVPQERLLKRALARVHLASVLPDAAAATEQYALATRDLDLVTDPQLQIDARRLRLELASQQLDELDPQRDGDRMLGLLEPAIAGARALVAERHRQPQDVRQLVSLLRSCGLVHARNRRPEAALAALDEAVALARSLPEDNTLWPPSDQLLAGVLLTLGNTCVQQRDERAAAALKECLRLREQGVAAHPYDVLLRSELGAAWHALAQLNVAQAQDELALQRLDRAIEEQRRVLQAMPGFATGRQYLRNHLSVRATTLARLQRPRELLLVIDELAAMRDDAAAQRTAARNLMRGAPLLPAVEAGGGDLPTAAACAERALSLLQRAEQLGWGQGNPLDDDLYAPLRPLPGFAALRERVAAQVGPPRAARADQTAVSPPSTNSASREMPR